MDGLIQISPCSATITRVPFDVEIFLLLEHGKYVKKYWGRGVIWSVVVESSIQ